MQKIGIRHSDFTKIANIIYYEAGTGSEKEALWLSHTVKIEQLPRRQQC